MRENQGSSVLVVSHKAMIRVLLSSLVGLDPRRYRDDLDQNPATLNVVDFKDAVRARLFNDASHYDNAGSRSPRCSARVCRSGGTPRLRANTTRRDTLPRVPSSQTLQSASLRVWFVA